MANASIGGMISGLDTATIISQLMQLEARSQTQLKGRVTTQQRQVTSLQTVNAKLANITTKAADLAKTTAWTPTTATSSNDKVAVTADSGAVAGSLTFSVGKLAASASMTYTKSATKSTVVATPNTQLTITFDDAAKTPVTVDTGDGRLDTITAALNATGKGVDAVLVRTGGTDLDPTFRLSVMSEASGALSGFSIATSDGSPFLEGTAGGSAGADAEITLAGQASPLKFSSNTITDLMPGVDVTLQPDAKAGDTATITVARDAKAMTATVKSLVDNLNGLLDEIGSLTAYGAGGKSAGILAGDSTLRGVRDQLLSAITGGVDKKSLSTYGIQVDRYGKVTFDEAIFQKAYETDPVGTSAAFTSNSDPTSPQPASFDGLAVTLKRLGDLASNSTTGTVTSAIKGRTESIDDMNDAIDAWDVRLETKRLALQRQYAALEVALGSLQNQSSWLAGQIAGLPKMNSGS
jgi:flagellar hook-associated protein 2